MKPTQKKVLQHSSRSCTLQCLQLGYVTTFTISVVTNGRTVRFDVHIIFVVEHRIVVLQPVVYLTESWLDISRTSFCSICMVIIYWKYRDFIVISTDKLQSTMTKN